MSYTTYDGSYIDADDEQPDAPDYLPEYPSPRQEETPEQWAERIREMVGADASIHLDLMRQAHAVLAEMWDATGSPPGLAARHRRALEGLQAYLVAAGVDPYPPGWRGGFPAL